MDRRTDQQAFFPIEMQFYISAMFVGFPDEIHEEKPSFLDIENYWLRMDRRTVVRKLVIAIGEVVWPPETANMFKRLLNLVGVTRSMRLSYTSSRSSEYDQK